jgi:hypothetical protein
MEVRQAYGLNDPDFVKLQKETYLDITDASSTIDSVSDETAFQVISHIRTYFDFSSKRIIEVVPMICDIFLTEKLQARIDRDFLRAIGVLDNGKCATYGQEDPRIRELRQDLLRKKGIVERALEITSRSIN